MMDRLKEWDEFAALVREHIELYAIPQYGDNQAGAYTAGGMGRICAEKMNN